MEVVEGADDELRSDGPHRCATPSEVRDAEVACCRSKLRELRLHGSDVVFTTA
jgi:hypothetical protein